MHALSPLRRMHALCHIVKSLLRATATRPAAHPRRAAAPLPAPPSCAAIFPAIVQSDSRRASEARLTARRAHGSTAAAAATAVAAGHRVTSRRDGQARRAQEEECRGWRGLQEGQAQGTTGEPGAQLAFGVRAFGRSAFGGVPNSILPHRFRWARSCRGRRTRRTPASSRGPSPWCGRPANSFFLGTVFACGSRQCLPCACAMPRLSAPDATTQHHCKAAVCGMRIAQAQAQDSTRCALLLVATPAGAAERGCRPRGAGSQHPQLDAQGKRCMVVTTNALVELFGGMQQPQQQDGT